MIESELQELIIKIQKFQAEFQTIEVKAAHYGCPKRLYDTLSSFSNQDDGGVLLFGLDEKNEFELVGVYDVQELQKSVNEQCKQMSPVIRPVFTSISVNGKYVVSAEIPGIDITERPCFYSGVGRIKGSYIRSGDSDEPMSEYEVYSYEAYRKKYQDDIRINPRATMTSIDAGELQEYIQIICRANPNLEKLGEETKYELLNLTRDGQLTLSCIMLFSLYPQVFYPQYTINAMVVPGYERGDVQIDGTRFIDNKRIEGTLPRMLEEAMRFLHKNMGVKTILKPDTGERVDKPEYPPLALREAILNALIHRDYSIHTEGMPIEIILYKDRLEIRNPGGLYGRISIDKLGKVQPDTRNPVLARAMESLGKTENRYSGIPTIQRELRLAGLPKPVFLDSRNEFSVTFYNAIQPIEEIECTPDTADLLEFCKIPRSRTEIAIHLGLKTNYYVTKNYINPLIKEGYLKMTMPDKPKSKNQKYYSL